jgi:hypothetical protein
MKLPEAAVKEFMEIYRKKFGITLAFNDAEIKAVNFIKLMELITKTQKGKIPLEPDSI